MSHKGVHQLRTNAPNLHHQLHHLRTVHKPNPPRFTCHQSLKHSFKHRHAFKRRPWPFTIDCWCLKRYRVASFKYRHVQTSALMVVEVNLCRLPRRGYIGMFTPSHFKVPLMVKFSKNSNKPFYILKVLAQFFTFVLKLVALKRNERKLRERKKTEWMFTSSYI